ncbi:MAG: carbohydrate-binding domain-containing protein [Firmicutes bacterium]|nr:carbohydrate-binding domain-containing protein [Bacillota bacterium]
MKRKFMGIAAFTAAIMTAGISASAAAAIIRGDADKSGAVDVLDAVTVMKYVDEGTQFANLSYSDVNNDGAVDKTDAAYILKAVSGLYTIPDEAKHTIVLSDNAITFDGAAQNTVYAEIDNAANTIKIISPGTYNISGTLSDGQIIVDIPESYDNNNAELNLNGVTITNSNGPAIYGINGDIEISAKKNTVNTLTDGTPAVFETETDESGNETVTEDPNGCVFSHDGIKLKGTGSLVINGTYANGVSGKDEVVIQKLALTVNAVNNAVKAKDYVNIKSGTVNLTSTQGDGIRCTNGYVSISQDDAETATSVTIDAKDNGIFTKADSSETNSDISITGGTVNITVQPDGEADTENCNYDGIHTKLGAISITGGTVTAKTYCDGIQAAGVLTIDAAAVINVTTTGEITSSSGSGQGQPFNPWQQTTTTENDISAKGIKTDTDMFIKGGANITVVSTDDSVHANGSITISDAALTLAAGDDGVHADDTLTINDGCELTVSESYEGLEALTININGGVMNVYSTDDMVNAAGGNDGSSSSGPGGDPQSSGANGNININGGYLYCVNTTQSGDGGDGIDSNGSITMNGGTVIVNGIAGNTSNSSIDYDSKFTYTDGYLFATGGGSMASEITSGLTASNPVLTYGLSSSSSGGQGGFGRPGQQGSSSSANTIAKGTRLTLTDGSGNVIMTLVPVNNVENIVMAAGSKIKSGSSYTLYSGGNYSGSEDVYSTDGTLTGGTSLASKTAGSGVTSLS